MVKKKKTKKTAKNYNCSHVWKTELMHRGSVQHVHLTSWCCDGTAPTSGRGCCSKQNKQQILLTQECGTGFTKLGVWGRQLLHDCSTSQRKHNSFGITGSQGLLSGKFIACHLPPETCGQGLSQSEVAPPFPLRLKYCTLPWEKAGWAITCQQPTSSPGTNLLAEPYPEQLVLETPPFSQARRTLISYRRNQNYTNVEKAELYI